LFYFPALFFGLFYLGELECMEVPPAKVCGDMVYGGIPMKFLIGLDTYGLKYTTGYL
jgi:hypothetical protein